MLIKTLVKKVLKGITTSQTRVKIKKRLRHIKSSIHPVKKTELNDLKNILVDEFGIKAGDRLVVSSSFGNLNANFSPQELITLLQSIVTSEGLIMMPYYPPMNSDEWAEKGEIFNLNETKSGMGVLTNVFASMPDVYMSIHPTKAVCVWGKNAQIICEGHENATTPYYNNSPYGKLLEGDSKSLCLGLKNIPMFHAVEDILTEHYDDYYYHKTYDLQVVLKDGSSKVVQTMIHNTELFEHCISPGDYVKEINPGSYKRINFGLKYIVCVDNKDLLETSKKNFAKGFTRIKK